MREFLFNESINRLTNVDVKLTHMVKFDFISFAQYIMKQIQYWVNIFPEEECRGKKVTEFTGKPQVCKGVCKTL